MNPGGPFRAGILTISDRGSRGERTADESGETALEILEEAGFSVERREVVPDDPARIREALIKFADQEGLSLIVTSGGTGLAPTDVTPQATRDVLDYEVPGMAEAMRAAGLTKTPHAMLSRALAGVRGSCLVLNLPGSPRAVRESLATVLPALEHALNKLCGDPTDCAR
ncbi:MAG: MogA/MoaB family molybdenum cofactor biosynthesis protein [Thermodesulfobacteriota bacterium]